MTSDREYLPPLSIETEPLDQKAFLEIRDIKLSKIAAQQAVRRIFYTDMAHVQGDHFLLNSALNMIDALASPPEQPSVTNYGEDNNFGEANLENINEQSVVEYNKDTIIEAIQRKLKTLQPAHLRVVTNERDQLSHALTILGLVIFQDLLSNGIPIPPKSKNSITPPPDLQQLPADKINGYIAQVNEMTNRELSELLAIPRNDIMQATRVEELAIGAKHPDSDIGI